MVWKGFVDLTADVTVLIDGTDYTAYLTQGRIESTLIDSENPLGKLWQGGLTLAIDGLTLVDLDPTTNADFNPGNQIEVQANGNTWYWRVAKAVVSQWDSALAASQTEIEVTCKLGMVNRDFPAQPTRRISTTRSRTNTRTSTLTSVSFSVWTDQIKSELTAPKDASNVAYLVDADIDFSGVNTDLAATFYGGSLRPDGFIAAQKRGSNPYINAASIASARGYLLYCDPANEIIKVQKYPTLPDEATLAGRWALEQLAQIEPSVQPLDEAVEAVTATVFSTTIARPTEDGGDEEDMQTYPITIALAAAPSPGTGADIVVCERIEDEPSDGSTSWRQDYEIRARQFWLFPATQSGNTAWVTVCQGEISRTFNGLGLPLTNNDVMAISRGIEIDNGVPKTRFSKTSTYYGDTTLVGGQGTREQFTYDTRGVPIERVLDTYGTLVSLSLTDEPGQVETSVTAVRLLSRELERNTYKPDGRYQQIVGYSIAEMSITSRSDDTGLVRDPNQKPVARTIDAAPKPPSIRPATEPVALDVRSRDEAVASNLGKRRSVTIQRAWGTDGQHATAIARMILALKQTGQLSFDVERAVVSGESLTPARMEHVGDRALIRDAEYLEFAPRRIVFGYTGREAGRLGSAVTVPKRPINTTGGLQAGPMGDLV